MSAPADGGDLGTAVSTTSGTTLSGTTSQAIAVGEEAYIVIATDNLETTDGNSGGVTSTGSHDVRSVTVGGVVCDHVLEFQNANAAAAAGATISVWKVQAKTTIATAATVTVTFKTAVTAKSYTSRRIVPTSGKETTVAASSTLANDAADAGSMTISGLTSGDYYFLRCIAVESSTTTWTKTAAYTAWAINTAVLAAATSMGVRAEYEIKTAVTASDASDPTTTASDQASILLALTERTINYGWTDPVKMADFAQGDAVIHTMNPSLAVGAAIGDCVFFVHGSTIDSGTVATNDNSVSGFGGIVDGGFSDSLGNVYTRVAIGPRLASPDAFTMPEIWCCPAITVAIPSGTSTTWTITGSARGLSITGQLWKATPPAGKVAALDVGNTGADNNFQHNWTAGSVTPTQIGDLIIGCFALGSGSAAAFPIIPGAGGQARLGDLYDATNARGMGCIFSYNDVTTAFTPRAGVTSDVTGAACAVALKAVATATTSQKTGSVTTGALGSGGDSFQPSETGSVRTSGLGSGPDSFNPSETGSVATATLLSGPDSFNPSEAGSLLTAALASGPDAFSPSETGSLLAASVLSGPDSFNPSETGSLLAQGVLSGVSLKAVGGKAGSLLAGLVMSGPDSAQMAEAGSLIASALFSGPDASTFGETGSVAAQTLLSGPDAATHAEAGSLLLAALLAGVKLQSGTKTGSIIAGDALSGADASAFAETGSILAAISGSGADALTYTETGSLIMKTFGAGADSYVATKTGMIFAGGQVYGADVHIAVRTGSIIAVGELHALHASEYRKAGSLLAQALLSGIETGGDGVELTANPPHMLTSAKVERGKLIGAGTEEAVLVVTILGP